MADGTNISPPDDSYSAPSGGGSSWVSSHKYAVAGGGVVLLVAVFVFMRKKSSGSSSGSVGTSTGPAVYEIAPGYLTGNGTASGAYGASTGYDQQIAGNTTNPGPTGGGNAATGTPTYTGATPTQSGYGYGGDTTFTTSSGQSFVALPNGQAASDVLAKGGTLDYQPAPGVAAKWDPNVNGMNNGSPTWLYEPLNG